MVLVDSIFLTFYIFLLLPIFFPKPKAETKTPEQELGDAIAKYLKSTNPPKD
jgi:hypothetical protein